MSDTECCLKIRLVRFDGEAVMEKWQRYPRVPVVGDHLIVDGDGDCCCSDEVKKVELVPICDECRPTAWVELEDKFGMGNEWDWTEDEVYGKTRRENIREAMECYIEWGFTCEHLATVWIPLSGGRGMWIHPHLWWPTEYDLV